MSSHSVLRWSILTLTLYLAVISVSAFEVGEIVIVRNLKWKRDKSVRAAVTALNNSMVKIVDHNTSRSERHEFTIKSLQNPSVHLMVPKKKLQRLSRIMVYDYSNQSAILMMQKFNELIQDPSNHVVVLPLWPTEFGTAIKRQCGNLDPPRFLNLIDWTSNILMTRKFEFRPLDASALSKALNYMEQHIPNELERLMKQEMFKWARTQNGTCYYSRILRADWKSLKCTKFAVDCNQNVMIIRKMQDILRVMQSNHPCPSIRNLDWMYSMKHDIGAKVVEYWLGINNPKKYNKKQQLHVLWKWNAVAPGLKFIDVDPQNVFGGTKWNPDPRFTITTDDKDLVPEHLPCLYRLMNIYTDSPLFVVQWIIRLVKISALFVVFYYRVL